jgi:pimeloyl-ACP methyl ester carboxylesterase
VPDYLIPGSPIIVPVHGTDRTAETYRDRFSKLADKISSIVMAPLFPAGISTPDDLDEYKFLYGENIRYDKILTSMIKEISDYYGVGTDIFLYGFSGGAQFAHRFAMLYPEKIKGLSIAAPGLVTLPDETKPWWVGTANVETLFGKKIEWSKTKNLSVQMLIGELDTDPREITVTENEQCWMEGANDAGRNRKD